MPVGNLYEDSFRVASEWCSIHRKGLEKYSPGSSEIGPYFAVERLSLEFRNAADADALARSQQFREQFGEIGILSLDLLTNVHLLQQLTSAAPYNNCSKLSGFFVELRLECQPPPNHAHEVVLPREESAGQREVA